MILPAAQKTQCDVADSLSSAKTHGLTVDKQTERLRDMSLRIEDFITCLDGLETMTDDAYWPLPKYRELLFLQ